MPFEEFSVDYTQLALLRADCLSDIRSLVTPAGNRDRRPYADTTSTRLDSVINCLPLNESWPARIELALRYLSAKKAKATKSTIFCANEALKVLMETAINPECREMCFAECKGYNPPEAHLLAQARAVVAYAHFQRYRASEEEHAKWLEKHGPAEREECRLRDLFAAAKFARLNLRNNFWCPAALSIGYAFKYLIDTYAIPFKDFCELYEEMRVAVEDSGAVAHHTAHSALLQAEGFPSCAFAQLVTAHRILDIVAEEEKLRKAVPPPIRFQEYVKDA